jgi:hypothetical protein
VGTESVEEQLRCSGDKERDPRQGIIKRGWAELYERWM